MLEKKIEEDLISGLKSNDKVKVSVLRMLKSALANKKIALQKDLTEEDVVKTIQGEIKQTQESLAAFKNVGRETGELEKSVEILQTYLPAQLDEATVEKIIDEAIEKTGANSFNQMGLVMKEIMPRIAGQADGALISGIVKRKLNSPVD